MITKDNLKEVLSSLKKEDVHKAMDSDKAYVAVCVHIFNAGSFSSIEAVDYSEEIEAEVLGSGNLLIDKDEFLRLYVESGAHNEAIEQYV